MIERIDADVRRPASARTRRRVRRCVDESRRLAVPELHGRPAATSTTCATRWCRSSTSATRPCPGATTAGWPGSPRAATARWSCRCSGPMCSARSPRTPATRCSSAATSASSRLSRVTLRDRFDGSYEVFFERLAEADQFDWGRVRRPFEMYGYASAYSPDPERPGRGAAPVRARDRPARARGVGAVAGPRSRCGWRPATPPRCSSLRRIYLDAGRSDEYFLDLGAQAFSAELAQLGVDHSLELFDGRHGGISYRYPKRSGSWSWPWRRDDRRPAVVRRPRGAGRPGPRAGGQRAGARRALALAGSRRSTRA